MDMQKKMVNLNIENPQSNPFKNYNRKWVAYPDVLPNKTLVNYMTPKNSNALNIYQRSEGDQFITERRESKSSSIVDTSSNTSDKNSRSGTAGVAAAESFNELMINPIIKNIFLRPQVIEINDLSRLTKPGSAMSSGGDSSSSINQNSSSKSCITCFNFDTLAKSQAGSSYASRRGLNVINKGLAASLLDSSKAKQAFDASLTQSKLKSSSSSSGNFPIEDYKLAKEDSLELAADTRQVINSELSDSETYSEGFEKSSRLTNFTSKKSLDFKDNFSTVVKIDIKFKGGDELKGVKVGHNNQNNTSSRTDKPKEWNRNVLIMSQREKVIESLMKTTIQNSRPKSSVNEDQLKQLQSNSRSFKVISPEENLIAEKINIDYERVALSKERKNVLKEKKRAVKSAAHSGFNGDLLISYSQERENSDTGEFVKQAATEPDRTNLLIETEKRLENVEGNEKIINATPSTSSSDINTTYRFRSSSSYSKSSNKSLSYYNDEDVSPSRLSLADKTDCDEFDTGSNNELDNEQDEEDEESSASDLEEEDSKEDGDNQIEETGSMNEVLAKYGLDYRGLFSTVYTRNEKGSQVKLMSPLILSLFANVPPTIRFVTHDDKVNELPDSIKRLLRWKIVSITPNIVRATIFRSNFLQSSNKNDWIGIWGSHMKPECFKSIKDYQKINHLPGSFQIGRKDRLCRNLGHAQAVYGKSEYNFVPLTFILPSDYNQLKAEFENANLKWIIKPPASARGQGIRVVNKLESMPKKRTCVVQKYLSNPYLIDGLKFDLRIYVYVSSFDPLRIYIFNDGLTRFASKKYSLSSKNISDKYIHLTNFSINKTNKDYKSNDDENACTGHKWSLKSLWTYLKKKGVNTDKVWANIVDLVIKTIIIADSHVNVLVKSNLKRKYSVHELFGFDVILDENLKPWIVEVNISPSLHSTSSLDVNVKGPMIADLLNIASFRIPNPKEIAKADGKKSYKKLPKLLLHDKSVLPQQLSNDEKAKHQYYIQRASDSDVLPTILNVLTPDDLRILIESEDELARSGQFERIFPAKDTRKYMKLFDTTRYYNLLLQEWIAKYGNNREKGISIINNYCIKKIHLQNPTESPENQWSVDKVTSRN